MNNPMHKHTRVTFPSDTLHTSPLRRSRADTMPSQSSTFPYVNDDDMKGRIRSGSVNTSDEYYLYDPSSPIDENTIVSTLASLGLNDDHDDIAIRARSYTVTANPSPSLFNPFNDPTRALQRQRAISLGMADMAMSNLFSPFDTVPNSRYRMSNHTSSSSSTTYIAPPDDDPDSPSSSELQMPSRALWLGNINPSVSVSDLTQFFSAYGHVESARILSDKECAFVNFTMIESAAMAKNDLENRLGSKLLGHPVRVGYGKADVNVAMALTSEAGPNAQGPTRALWVGNIPANMNPDILRSIFQEYGLIDSIRVLSHKNCGFVNFVYQEDAVKARKHLQNKEILGAGTGTVRIGFARAPEDEENAERVSTPASSIDSHDAPWTYTQQEIHQSNVHAAHAAERIAIMNELGYEASDRLKAHRMPIHYYSAIPAVPEITSFEGYLEPFFLRELRKRLDNAGENIQEEVQLVAMECSSVIVELCSDYIGNTIVQRLFEYGSENVRLSMLEKIAPYLASIGVHKNGTWAAQKIIDHSNTPALIHVINQHIAPYVPSLLLDQFGNYVVQCCLRKGPERNQYIYDAIVDKCWEIGQGRFGARAIRAILENKLSTTEQIIYIASAIVQNAVLLTTNVNGILLITWLLDASELNNRYRVLCPRLLPYLNKLSMHKLGSLTISKILHQTQEPDVSILIMNSLSAKSKAELTKK